jgi:CDP-glycerol glycerophosphotransferase
VNSHGRSRVRTISEWLVWTASALVPKNPRLIVVQSLTESEDGVQAVEQRLLRRGHSPVRLTDVGTSAYRSPSVRYFRKLSLQGLWTFARSGVVITSHALFGGLTKAPGQRNVLLWHGEVVKPVGALHNDRAFAADLAPVCSEIGRRYRCAEFHLKPEQVPVIGAPRNDRMLAADRRAVRRRLGWREEDTVWLWLPTYRGPLPGGRGGDSVRSSNGLPFDNASLNNLGERLASAKITLVLKPHPMAVVDIGDRRQGLHVVRQQDIEDSGTSLYEMLAAVDGLVTDASSVWIDYLLTQRPIIFAFPDIDDYRQGRGLNLEPYEDWAPGPIARDGDTLVRLMTDFRAGQDRYVRRRSEMLSKFHAYRDAGSADRLLDLLGF